MDTGTVGEATEVVRRGEKPSLRTCIVTRAELPPGQMIRFVPGPDDVITPDLARRLPGRGVWVTSTMADVEKAVKSKAFTKSLKRAIVVPADLAALVDRLMLKRTIEALALANKAGAVVTGFAKVDAELSKANIVAVIHATDAAVDGTRKLDRKWLAIARSMGSVPRIINELSTAHLDLAMGRENVVHAGIGAGGAGLRFLTEAERLAHYRKPESSTASDTPAATIADEQVQDTPDPDLSAGSGDAEV